MQFFGRQPVLGKEVFIAPGAVVLGAVELGDEASVWFGCVLRGDVDAISIGASTNVQDLSMLHVTRGFPLTLGRGVTVGHRCLLHGCTVGDDCLLGMGSIVCDGAVLAPGTLLGAGSLVPPGKSFPPGVLLLGSPAKVVRELSAEEREHLRRQAVNYREYARQYRSGLGGTTDERS